jgi:hypothetical protein
MEDEFRDLITPHAARCYWGRGPQTPEPDRPYVVLTEVSRVHDYHMQGRSPLTESRIQIDVYADDILTLRSTTRAISDGISGYRGGALRGVFIEGERGFPISSSDPSETHRSMIDAMVMHVA